MRSELPSPPRCSTRPPSAVFVFETPIRMTCSARLFPANAEDNRWHGWGIPFSVNGRNRFGGYAGAQQFIGFVMVDRVEVFLPRYRNNMHCRPE